jgi:hypothetical protein
MKKISTSSRRGPVTGRLADEDLSAASGGWLQTAAIVGAEGLSMAEVPGFGYEGKTTEDRVEKALEPGSGIQMIEDWIEGKPKKKDPNDPRYAV